MSRKKSDVDNKKSDATEITYRKEFGQRLKTIRNRNELTQTEFGEKIGINQPTILRYEAGTRLPSLPLLKRIAAVYECDLNWLICGNKEKA